VVFGVEGDTIQGLRFRLENNPGTCAELAIILIGTNDCLQRRSRQDILNDYECLVGKLLTDFKEIVLIEVPPVASWREDANRINETIALLNQEIGDFESDRIKVLHINELMKQSPDWKYQYLLGDGVHLSANGYALLRNVLQPIILDEK